MKRVCVFCGSSDGARDQYRAAAVSLGGELTSRGLGLVYGGAHVGLMGAVADATLAAGGEAIGVIPEALMQKELAHRGLTALHVTSSMHERKALMADLSDGFIALPGGLGTWEELFEVLTWAQLGIHRKPCGVLNVEGYFDLMIAALDHSVREGFVRPAHRALLLEAGSPSALLDLMATRRTPIVEKWLDRAST
jgi:uncharacterized protein (TIGR00730 family)